MSANSFGVATSRQTLHNWYIGKYLPNKSLLDLYIRILKGRRDTGTRMHILEMYENLYKAAGHGE
jgi:hypothetical protein